MNHQTINGAKEYLTKTIEAAEKWHDLCAHIRADPRYATAESVQSITIKRHNHERDNTLEADRDALETKLDNALKQKNSYIDQLRVTHDQRDDAIRRAESAEARVEELDIIVNHMQGVIDDMADRNEGLVVANERLMDEKGAVENERDDLRAENKRLEKEFAGLVEDYKYSVDNASRAGARAGARARNAEARVEELENDAQLDYDATKKVKAERDDLRTENKRLKQDLRQAQRDVQDYMRREARTAVPRVIRPDEWEHGQTIAYKRNSTVMDSSWGTSVIIKDEGGGPLFFMTEHWRIPQTDCDEFTIILLENAPKSADDVTPIIVNKGDKIGHMYVDVLPKRGRPIDAYDIQHGDTVDIYDKDGAKKTEGAIIVNPQASIKFQVERGHQYRLIKRNNG